MNKNDDFYRDDPGDESKSLIGAALLFSAAIVLIILVVVIVINKDNFKFHKKNEPQTPQKVEGYVNLDDYISGEETVSDDLDIWNEYLDEKEEKEETVDTTTDTDEGKTEEEDLSAGGTKTKVVKSISALSPLFIFLTESNPSLTSSSPTMTANGTESLSA